MTKKDEKIYWNDIVEYNIQKCMKSTENMVRHNEQAITHGKELLLLLDRMSGLIPTGIGKEEEK